MSSQSAVLPLTDSARAAEPTRHTEVSVRAHLVYGLAKVIGKQGYRIWPVTDWGIRALTVLDTVLGAVPSPVSVARSRIELGGVPVDRHVPSAVAADGLAGASVLYLHGGGFTFCGPGTHRAVVASMAGVLEVPVYSVRYRQLPDGGVGSAIHDAYAAYRALLDSCADPAKVIVAGDSSGAFLAGKICEFAAQDGLARPAAFVGYSPHVDLDVDARDHELLRHDALMPVSAYRRVKRLWARGPIPARGARSLLDVDPAAFPATFLVAATREMFEADILDLGERLAAAGRPVETHIWDRQVHAFPVLDAILPENREVLRDTAEFLRHALPETHRAAV
ncbi:alpha/beta hydrolase [Nocardia sp. NPDC059177]|uniref:alpha/beta hydrolase n=1 Tax=Nocardia sp. NPDC059177 TaxID=3346759 RepID=UPI00367F9CBB